MIIHLNKNIQNAKNDLDFYHSLLDHNLIVDDDLWNILKSKNMTMNNW